MTKALFVWALMVVAWFLPVWIYHLALKYERRARDEKSESRL